MRPRTLRLAGTDPLSGVSWVRKGDGTGSESGCPRGDGGQGIGSVGFNETRVFGEGFWGVVSCVLRGWCAMNAHPTACYITAIQLELEIGMRCNVAAKILRVYLEFF